jgi:hypothetical protein
MRSLELDGFHSTLVALLVGTLLLFGWLAWFFFAKVSLYAVTDAARLEVGRGDHPVSGRVIIVAEFAPPEALGRVRPDQRGRFRLEGLPWVQYRTVHATVARVATDTENGKIRVELDVEEAPDFPVSLQPGLTGTLEIEVEKVSPANLVLRSIGRASSHPVSEDRASR